jgi:hypothetical protein
MLGGFAPLPLRHGGNAIDGFTAEQHARVASDLTGLVRVAPFACIWLRTNSTTVYGYIGQHGCGIPAAPSIAAGGALVTATWDDGYYDEYENYHAVNFKYALATSMTGSSNFALVTINSAKEITARVISNAGVAQLNKDVFVAVW